MKEVDEKILLKSVQRDTAKAVAFVGVSKQSTLEFLRDDVVPLVTQYTTSSSMMYAWMWWWISFVVAGPGLVCMLACCGISGLHFGGWSHSDLLDGWDKEHAHFDQHREILHLEGCFSHCGAKLNACSWCCALVYATLHCLLGGGAFFFGIFFLLCCTYLLTDFDGEFILCSSISLSISLF